MRLSDMFRFGLLVSVMMLVPVMREVRVVIGMLRCARRLRRNGDLRGTQDEPRHSRLERQHEADRQHAARDEERQQ